MLVSLGVMVVGGIILALRLVLPVNPRQPYFSATEDRAGSMHWGVGYFQPVFLWAFEKGDGIFFKVAYRDVKNKIRVMNVSLGKKGSLAGIKTADGKWRKPQILADYRLAFLPGRRMTVSYFRNVIRREEEMYRETVAPGFGTAFKYCTQEPKQCDLAKYTQEYAEDLWQLKLTGVLDKNIELKALHAEAKVIK